MFVKDWMTADPVSIPSDATVAEARVFFESKAFRHLPVVEDGKVIGMFTHTDQLKVNTDHQMTQVKQWMSKPIVEIEPSATIEKAALLLRQHKIGCLPVIGPGGSLVGIITESDVLELLVDVLGFRSGGARMVLEAPADQPGEAIDQLADLVREHQLSLSSVVFYRPRGDQQQLNVVVRVGGSGGA